LHDIAIARQIFQNKVFFFTSWGSFPCKKKKKVFMKNLPGASNTTSFSNLRKLQGDLSIRLYLAISRIVHGFDSDEAYQEFMEEEQGIEQEKQMNRNGINTTNQDMRPNESIYL
jgi:hypothetical protein